MGPFLISTESQNLQTTASCDSASWNNYLQGGALVFGQGPSRKGQWREGRGWSWKVRPGAHLWGARTLSFYPLVRRWDSILWVFIKGTIGSICCSVAPSCLTLCDPMNCSTPGFPVLHHLLELAQTHVHWVGDAIQPSHPLSPPFPPALNLSPHQGLFHQVFASGGESIGSSGYGICKSH